VYLVVDGLLKIVKMSRTGRVSFIGLQRPGTLVGELGVLSPGPRSASLAAVTDTIVVRIAPPIFLTLLRAHADLAHALLEDLADRLRDATDQIHELMSADATSRMASRLVELAADAGSYDEPPAGVVIRLPISQQELGEWAGLSRAGAVKALHDLRELGLIETSRMVIAITNLDALRTRASA
jgi:CRP-like cAMP-binding protein